MTGDGLLYIRAFAALVFVLALLGAVAYIARRFSGAPLMAGKRQRRIGIVEVAAIDPKRRLILVRRDDTEHLLLIGGGQDLVIETGIAKPPPPPPTEPAQAVAPRSRLDEIKF